MYMSNYNCFKNPYGHKMLVVVDERWKKSYIFSCTFGKR